MNQKNQNQPSDGLNKNLKTNYGIDVKYYAPSADLIDIIKYYWIVDVKTTCANTKMAKISPTGYPEIIFHFGDSVSINTSTGELPAKSSDSIIAGQITHPVFIDMNPHLNCFCIKLHEWSLSALFGVKSSEFSNRAVSLDDITPQRKRIIQEQLSYAIDNTQRIKIIEFHLRELLKKNRSFVNPITAKIITSVRQGNNHQIKTLAKDFYLSSRTLQRRFNDEVGLSAKMFFRIIRFNKAYHLIKQNPQSNLQDICFQLGYYDLPHLINEFKRFSGKPPIQFFKDENVYNTLFTNDIKL